MQCAILMVAMPDGGQAEKQAWQAFYAATVKPRENQAVEELAYNIWQIDFRRSPVALAQLVAAADDFGFAYRVLPFDGEPQWIRVDPKLNPS